MDPITAALIGEGIKGVMAIIIGWSEQQGLTEQQIEDTFKAVLQGVRDRDPANIPDPPQ